MRPVRPRLVRPLAAGLRRWARGGASRAPSAGGGRVAILLMHAWGIGGATRATLDVSARLGRAHDVEVLSMVRLRDRAFSDLPGNVTITAVDDQRPGAVPLAGRLLGRVPSVLIPRADTHAAGACSLWTDLCLVRHLRRTRPAVLIGTRPGLSVLALDLAAPGTAVAAHERRPPAAHPPRVQRLIGDRYPGLDAIVALTHAGQRGYLDALGEDALPVLRIPGAARELGGPAPALEDRVILAAGRLDAKGGHDLLVAAFAMVNRSHPEWQLRICGDGPRRRRLQHQIGALGLGARVSLPGAIAGLGDEMASASMFVHPARVEGFPHVLVEAMRKGLPVVAFAAPGGSGEPVCDGADGILAPEGDIDGLARGMLALIEDEALRRRCGEHAARTAAPFAMEVVGPQWDGFVAGLLGPAASRAA